MIVAVPVKDEALRIADCLRALAWQHGSDDHEILLLLNNCDDGTEAVVQALSPGLPVRVHALVARLPPEQANAGQARSMALRSAAALASPNGVLLTTDADGRVAPDWIANNLAAIRHGAEAVAGRAEIDPDEAALIPAHLHADDALECAYAEQLDEIDWLVDPDAADPWPRHTEHSGASIAVTCAAWRRAGGMPAVPLGEDRAFFARLRSVDAVIRHAPEVRVTVSGRIDGRAQGGMADTIRRRIGCQDAVIDDRLEPAAHRLRRARLRVRYRVASAHGRCPPDLARALGLPVGRLAALLTSPFVGEGWAATESESHALRPIEVRRADLPHEIAAAAAILDDLRQGDRTDRASRPPDSIIEAAA